MKILLNEITVGEIFVGYEDNAENGVVAYGKKLNVRPAFQREFVYKDKQRDAVIDTVKKGFPLNVMYWAETDGGYELLDGQQRTLSLCQYINGDFPVESRFFHNLTSSEKEQILNYKLMIYICSGNDREKYDWFKIINIAGEKLTDQELRNAMYTGQWLSDAKRYFSKNGCPAYSIASKYMSGTPIRQDYLETAIKWIINKTGQKDIRDYMAEHQHCTNAAELWLYFQSVINWVQTIFPVYRKEMQGIEWGILFNKYGNNSSDPNSFENKICELMQDDDITSRKGIYEYLLSGEEKHLNIRSFTDNQKRKVYEKQKGICPHCKAEKRTKNHYELSEMEADHITPWCEGGKTEISNCQLLCREHNRRKSSR